LTLNFLLVAMDQVVNHAAKIGAMFGGEVRCPLVIRTPNGAGNQLTAQHSQSFAGWFAGTPGLKVVAPANPNDAKGLLKAAIRDDDPVLVIENLPIYKEKGEVEFDPELAARIQHACFDDLDVPVERVGMAEVPLPYAKELELAAMPTEDRIEAAVLRQLELA
jgi:pyruvate/2-oxoglutarate/acetoin dehydrogenase E1 component